MSGAGVDLAEPVALVKSKPGSMSQQVQSDGSVLFVATMATSVDGKERYGTEEKRAGIEATDPGCGRLTAVSNCGK